MGARAITDLDSVMSWAPSTQGVDDAVLERSLDSASALIEQYCGRRFTSADYNARHSGSLAYGCYSERLALSDPDNGLATPNVTEITVLTEEGAVLATATLGTNTIVDGEYALYGAAGSTLYRGTVASNLVSFGPWYSGDGNILISYTAGYDSTTMPAEIVQACIELTWLIYREGSRSGMSSRNASTGSASFARELSPAAQAALSFHIIEPMPRTLCA
jgi:hypothetical protein